MIMDHKDVIETYGSLSGEQRARILEGLRERRDDATARLLVQLLAMETEKDLKKEIKRLLFRLRTSGVRVEVEEVKPQRAVVLKPAERKKRYAGYLSSYDRNLRRVVGISFQAKKDSFLFLYGLDTLWGGLESLTPVLFDKQGLEEMLGNLRRAPSLFLLEVSPSYAMFLLREAGTRSGRSVSELKEMFGGLANMQDQVKEPKDIYSLNEGGSYFRASLEEVLNHQIFRTFAFRWEGIESDAKAYREVTNPPIVLPSYMRDERKQEFFRTLLKKQAIQERLAFLKRALEDYAYLLFLLKDISTFQGLLEILRRNDLYERVVYHFLEDALLSEMRGSPILTAHEALLPE